ncbi:WD40 repeat protein [Giardia muris]|uniref:WD40 repeat protein n=1 Tax=Giardia muris TaxID=5742 RepID=A0A4Z1SSN9_GIAMU|nr:WD40 repeat protein [Giardia muris]|eukprot:TNJ28932.1 WD40 repeat protein [Giardia muris]
MTVLPTIEIVIGTYSGKLYGFRLENDLTPVNTFIADDSAQVIRDLVVTSKGILISACNDGVIRLYNLRVHKYMTTLDQHQGSVRCLLLADSKTSKPSSTQSSVTYLVTGSDDKTMILWRLKDLEPMLILKRHRHGVETIALHPNGTCFTSTDKGRLIYWDLVTGNSITSVPLDEHIFYQEWRQTGNRDELILMSSTSVSITVLIEEVGVTATWKPDDIAIRLTCCCCAEWPTNNAQTLPVILVGTGGGLLYTLVLKEKRKEKEKEKAEPSYEVHVHAAFPVSNSRIKAIKKCRMNKTHHYFVVVMSDGEVLILEAIGDQDIDVCKRFYVPDRPTTLCLYPLDQEKKSKKKGDGPDEADKAGEAETDDVDEDGASFHRPKYM